MVRDDEAMARYVGPDDVRQEYRQRLPLPQRATIVENQRQYIRIQQAIVTYYAGLGESRLAVQPPCTQCPVDVFHYCETSGAECSRFRSYVGKGR